jgi:putative peptide zinc metalloprotease protein
MPEHGRAGADGRTAGADARPSALPLAAAGTAPARAEAPGKPGAPEAPIQVPERPQLAPGLELRGEMTESAYEEAPWLIERDRHYIQLPRLLYHVAQACDGRRSHAEIAAVVSDQLDRDITDDNIRTLVGNLVKAGLVVDVPAAGRHAGTSESAVTAADGGASGASTGAAAPTSRTASRSPLAITRMAMIGPRFVEPAARLFRFLYLPPVLLAVLAAAMVAQVWLYAIHGVGGGLHDAFYTPGLMLVVLLVVVVATGFHEFGHAAALAYGGGRVGGMGAGIYLVYPAFYTDVTDNYRLSRWARVRTDLGGFYFNLIFVLGLMAVYAATGLEFLLLVVVVINLEIIHQLLPFLRLDGYWALADATGIPDFFSQIPSFLRSVLPAWVPFPKGPTMAPLKPWARVFFLLYIVITIPLLLALLLMTLRAAPRVLATIVDAIGQQLGGLPAALAAGDLLQVAARAVQVVFLAIPALGLSYTFVVLGRTLFRVLRRWSQASAVKRGIASAAGVAAVIGLVLLWGPVLPPPGGPPTAIRLAAFQPIVRGERWTIQEVYTESRYEPAADAVPPPANGSPGTSPLPSPSAPPSGSPTAPGATSTPSDTTDPGSTPTPPPASATPAPTDATAVPTTTGGPTPAPTPAPTVTPAPTTVAPTVSPGPTTTPAATATVAPTTTPAPTGTAAVTTAAPTAAATASPVAATAAPGAGASCAPAAASPSPSPAASASPAPTASAAACTPAP